MGIIAYLLILSDLASTGAPLPRIRKPISALSSLEGGPRFEVRRLPPAWVSRFGAVRFPAGRVETAPFDGGCLRDVIRRKADKSPELAVEPSQ